MPFQSLPPAIRNTSIVGIALLVLGATAVGMPTQDFFYLLGHLSFVITFLAYAQSNLIRLRLIAVCSLVVGLVYNTYVHMNMPDGQNLWPVLLWMGVFLVQNIVNSVREVNRSLEIAVPAHERLIQASAFPRMHSRDWMAMSAAAKKSLLPKGHVVLATGAATYSLQMLVMGTALEQRSDQVPLRRRMGALWGELTWVLGEEMFNSSPCEVLITSEDAEAWEWDYTVLDRLCKGNDRLSIALKDGFVRSASFKHGLLAPRRDDQEPLLEPRRQAAPNFADGAPRETGLVGASHSPAYAQSAAGK